MADPLLGQFPGRKGGPLATGTGLITEHPEIPALLAGLIHRCRGRADVDKREPTRIAVGQDGHSIADQMGTPSSDRTAFLDIPIRETPSRVERQALLFRNGPARGHPAPNLSQGIAGVDCGRSGRGEYSLHLIQMSSKRLDPLASEGPCALGQPVRRGGANRSGTPDHHVADRRCRLHVSPGPDQTEPVWEQPLLDQDNGIPGRIESNSAIVTDLATDQDVHRRTT